LGNFVGSFSRRVCRFAAFVLERGEAVLALCAVFMRRVFGGNALGKRIKRCFPLVCIAILK
jgi:hypothetical protein